MRHMTSAPRVRLSPEERREQLLDLGARLMATRTLEDVSIDVLAEEASISRGLLYHYFGTKKDFHEAVVRRVVERLHEATAPVEDPDVIVRLSISLRNYLDFVTANETLYRSFRKAAHGGNERMRTIYEDARAALIDRIFDVATEDELAAFGLVDTPALRMHARSWGAYVEDLVLSWLEDDRGVTADALLEGLVASLAGVLSTAPPA